MPNNANFITTSYGSALHYNSDRKDGDLSKHGSIERVVKIHNLGGDPPGTNKVLCTWHPKVITCNPNPIIAGNSWGVDAYAVVDEVCAHPVHSLRIEMQVWRGGIVPVTANLSDYNNELMSDDPPIVANTYEHINLPSKHWMGGTQGYEGDAFDLEAGDVVYLQLILHCKKPYGCGVRDDTTALAVSVVAE